jgi:hypothetical protein
MALPQQLRELPQEPAVPLLGRYLQELKARTRADICIPTFIAALFTLDRRGCKPKYSLTNSWLSKMSCIYPMEYYPAFKKEGILIYDTTWMNLEDITLSEIKQSPKDKYCMVPLM